MVKNGARALSRTPRGSEAMNTVEIVGVEVGAVRALLLVVGRDIKV